MSCKWLKFDFLFITCAYLKHDTDFSWHDYDVTNGIIFMMLYKVCIMGLPSKTETKKLHLDWLQSLKQFFINVSYQILVASLTLMALFKENRG